MQKSNFRQFCSAFGIAILLLFSACSHTEHQQVVDVKADTVVLKYATGFQIVHTKAGTEITLKNPWDKETVYAKYLLDTTRQLNSMAEQHIATHLQKVGAFSSTVIGYLKLLQSAHIIAGVTDGNHVYDSLLFQKFTTGQVQALGQNMIDNFEAILDLEPDALIKSGFEQSPTQDSRYLQAGIPVIYVNDWTESTPLARAEWIKFIACFIGKNEQADSIFDGIEKRYLQVKAKAAEIAHAPTVMAGGDYKGTWYVPGGRSYFSCFIADAHGAYAWANDTTVGSISLSLEPVVEQNINDTYWFTTHNYCAAELAQIDKRYSLFKSVRQQNLYSYSKRIGTNGGNDYWESGVCRPDIILKDIVQILHPDVFDGELYYYTRLLNSSTSDSRP